MLRFRFHALVFLVVATSFNRSPFLLSSATSVDDANRDLYATYDIVVVGGGPVGLATAFESAKAGKKVLVLEQSIYFNQAGSSGDNARMFRTAYTEDFMATLAVQSMEVWDELEKEAGEPLRVMSGLVNFGDKTYGAGGPEGTLEGPIKNLDQHNMSYTILDRNGIQQRLPFQNLPDDWVGIDMPDNGYINLPLLLRTLYRLCEKHGVVLYDYATVDKLERADASETPRATWIVEGEMRNPAGSSAQALPFAFRTDKIAITAGAYVNHILHPSFGFALDVNIWEMAYAYYAVDPEIQFEKMWFQFAEDSTRDGKPVSNLFYGFPALPWGPQNLCRIAVDHATNVISDPDERSYATISPEDLENTRTWISKHVLGVGPNPLPVSAGTCLQTNIADNMFVLDYVPSRFLGNNVDSDVAKSVVVFTAGWAMKFVPLLGRALKDLLVDGKTQYNITHFAMDRKADGKPIIRKERVVQIRNLAAGTRRDGSSMHRRRLGH